MFSETTLCSVYSRPIAAEVRPWWPAIAAHSVTWREDETTEEWRALKQTPETSDSFRFIETRAEDSVVTHGQGIQYIHNDTKNGAHFPIVVKLWKVNNASA